MSDQPAAPAPTAAAEPALDLGALVESGVAQVVEPTAAPAPHEPVVTPESAPTAAPSQTVAPMPSVRRALLISGSMLLQAMAAKDILSDQLAAAAGMDELRVLRILTGSAPDVKFRELALIAGVLGFYFAPDLKPLPTAGK